MSRRGGLLQHLLHSPLWSRRSLKVWREERGASQWQWGQGRLFEVRIVFCGSQKMEIVSRCGTKVFLMDMVRGKSGLYHKQCLSCATCKSVPSIFHLPQPQMASLDMVLEKKLFVCWVNLQSPVIRMALSPGNFSCGEDGDIYCRNCYSTK